jgi:hypothetical protein
MASASSADPSCTRASLRRGVLAVLFASTTAVTLAVACASPSSPTSSASSTGEGGAAPAPTLGGGGDPFPEDASIGARARYVLGGCTGGPESACHGIGAAGMFLPDRVPSNLVDVPSSEEPSLLRIKRGDPGSSYLYRKIMGGPDIDGGRMPLDLPPLDERSTSAIASWIEAGAPAP